MPKLKTLSGEAIIRILEGCGFVVIGQRGSHVKLRRTVNGRHQNLTVPHHRHPDKGMVHAIYRQAAQYVPDDVLRALFYSE